MAIEHIGEDITLSSRSIVVAGGMDGYGYGEEAKKPSSAPYINTDFSTALWSPWGTNNLLPVEIAEDIENCGVLSAALDAKARIGTGKGIQPFLLTGIIDGREILEHVLDPEIQDWLELSEAFEFAFDSSYDKHAYGWNAGSYVLNRGQKKIYRIRRHDVYEARLEKMDPSSRLIKNLYLCADWTKAGLTYDPTKQARITLLEEGNELADLQDRIANNSKSVEFGFINRTVRNGRKYYPIPLYRSSKAWIKIARSVPEDKLALFKNSIQLKYMIVIHPKFWEDKFGVEQWAKYTPEEKKKKREDYHTMIDSWLTGTANQYKSIFTGGFQDEAGKLVPYITVTEIDDRLKDGRLLPDSGAAINEILFALMINPALMGAGNPGGKAYGDTSGGSNVRESFLVQIMIMEAERRLNASIFNVVKKFNGWSDRLEVPRTIMPMVGAGEPTPQSRIIKPRLVFRNPTGLLTTLDTGKSTKSEVS